MSQLYREKAPTFGKIAHDYRRSGMLTKYILYAVSALMVVALWLGYQHQAENAAQGQAQAKVVH